MSLRPMTTARWPRTGILCLLKISIIPAGVQGFRTALPAAGRLYLWNLCSHLGLNLFSQGGAVNPLSHDSLCLGFVKELPAHFAAGSQARRRGASNKASGPGGLQQKCEFISVRALRSLRRC